MQNDDLVPDPVIPEGTPSEDASKGKDKAPARPQSERQKPLSAQEFLFPSRLQVTPTPINRLLLVGSCLSTELSKRLGKISGDVKHDFILFNNAAQLPEELPAPPGEYTMQILQIALRTLLTDQIVLFKEFRDKSMFGAILDRGMNTIDVMLEAGLKYQRAYHFPALVTNFIVPSTPIAACLVEEATSSDIAWIVRRLNEHLADRVADLKNVYLLDTDALAGALGKDAILDDWYQIFSHNAAFFNDWVERAAHPFYYPYGALRIGDFMPSGMEPFFSLIWRAIEAKIRALRQVDQVKLVIFDLDNTLWRGQIAEHYREGADHPLAAAWPQGLPEAIHHLRARGILVAICSKNDEEIVRERWDLAIPNRWLKLEDFVAAKINWQPKAVNIADILEATGLTPKSVVFVDDNPLEREAVATAFPAIRIIGDNPFLTRSILLRAPETQVAVLTQESARRENMIRKQIEREHERAVMSREEFLRGLDCKLEAEIITDESHPRFARALELINKTNQFNTTGRRWPASEIAALLAGGGRLIIATVSDKFTDYGLIGVIILNGATIEQFVMSCRVLGLEIEKAALSAAIGLARANGSRSIRALMQPTKENRVSQDVYLKAGFTPEDDAFVFDGNELPCPEHIVLTLTT